MRKDRAYFARFLCCIGALCLWSGWLVCVLPSGLVNGAEEEAERASVSQATRASNAPLIAKLSCEKNTDLQVSLQDTDVALRLELRLTRNGKTPAELGRRSAEQLWGILDADGNGRLRSIELQRLPSQFGLRQFYWDRPVPSLAFPPNCSDGRTQHRLAALNQMAGNFSEDGWCRDVLQRYLARSGVGTPLVTYGLSTTANELSARMLELAGEPPVTISQVQQLDTWLERLNRLDLDSDGVLEPAELIPGCRYPGTSASQLIGWSGWREHESNSRGNAGLAQQPLPQADGTVLEIQYDLSAPAAELQRYADDEGQWLVTWCGSSDASSGLTEAVERSIEAYLAEAAAHQDIEQFQPEPRNLLILADQNGDAFLDDWELDRWKAFTEASAFSRCLVLIVDYGHSLFAWMDADNSGGITRGELQRWRSVIEKIMRREGAWQFTGIPRRIHLILCSQRPESLLFPERRRGPKWFAIMDTNRDGVLIEAEFLGSSAAFGSLDEDGDGVVRLSEVSEGETSQ